MSARESTLASLLALPPPERRRCVHPESLPVHMAINVVDLDVTKSCNLRCTYCFKGEKVRPGGAHMSLEVAMCAVDWLIDAAIDVEDLWVNLLGGEPLVVWELVEHLVPYAKRRAAQFGKAIQFGTTTNLTLLNAEILGFARRYGMGWHCSIDGLGRVQDAQRPGIRGRSSSARAERGAALALSHRPGAMGRATITREFVGTMLDNVRYLHSKGFRSIGVAPADEPTWTACELAEWDRQMELIADYAIEMFRSGREFDFGGFRFIMESVASGQERRYGCGAGRGTVGIDHVGDIWPCHRFDGADVAVGAPGAWKLGNIFQPGFDHALHRALLERDAAACRHAECDGCMHASICAGGCAAANLQCTRDVYRQHPNTCAMARGLHRAALRVYHTLREEANAMFLARFPTRGMPIGQESIPLSQEGGPHE